MSGSPISEVGARRLVTRSTHQPMSVFHHEPAVGGDPAVCSRVDDQVPVQGRIVDAPRLRVALAERQVDGPPDLLIVEDAAREAIDAAVEPQPQLAQPPGAGVEIEHRQQVVFTVGGLRLDDSSRRETPG